MLVGIAAMVLTLATCKLSWLMGNAPHYSRVSQTQIWVWLLST